MLPTNLCQIVKSALNESNNYEWDIVNIIGIDIIDIDFLHYLNVKPELKAELCISRQKAMCWTSLP